mmetsp:Transcript_7844/g.24553  ORF Transcript_7844/g.24553 Transcript_7844/m.24553 type:complete len:310 (-) Transcript_7844:162-1091(-)
MAEQLPGCPKLLLLLVLLAVGATATRPRLRFSGQQHQRPRCEAPLCQWKPDLPPPDPDTVSARSAETQERLKVLIEELSAPPVSDQGAAPKPSAGYAVDYANLKPKANVFGARLDPKVAGDTLIGVNAAPEEPHEEIFAAGVKAMKGGYYKDAVRYFTQAVAAAPGGLTGREGGQYSVWLAQALQAAGRTKEAVGLLQTCESHPDSDVRKISESVLYVMRAPELKLGEENFVRIDFASEGPPSEWGRWKPKPRDPDDEPPEMYSLEWYVEEFEKRQALGQPAEREGAAAETALVLLGAVGVLAALSLAL